MGDKKKEFRCRSKRVKRAEAKSKTSWKEARHECRWCEMVLEYHTWWAKRAAKVQGKTEQLVSKWDSSASLPSVQTIGHCWQDLQDALMWGSRKLQNTVISKRLISCIEGEKCQIHPSVCLRKWKLREAQLLSWARIAAVIKIVLESKPCLMVLVKHKHCYQDGGALRLSCPKSSHWCRAAGRAGLKMTKLLWFMN